MQQKQLRRTVLGGDAKGNKREGGLARMYTLIETIRNHADDDRDGDRKQKQDSKIVAQYLQDNLGGALNGLEINRINLLAPLPDPVYGNNPEGHPLRGAQ